ncbi:type VI secretion protein [Spongiactinospora rosea]|uniref:Type VI secretion protein n=1 Tax=Spongiactinospora rosea TaxID=2248750 RepID=A0A366LLY7_9ACTN|nr:type IV secretion system DNA-binding domain-containing protein [Spongiactinospora rosea]RBQ14172.1 type VI secretion protein [Spongiactinospora rosea]
MPPDLTDLLDPLLAWIDAHGQNLSTSLITGGVALTLGRTALRYLRHRPLARNARCVEILTPPTADLDGAEALWANLIGLLHPRWKRAVLGQPHLIFEYLFNADGMRIQLWVPGVIPQHVIEHAVEAAWPSARIAVQHAGPPVPLTGQATGGRVTIARDERLPIRYDHPSDPLRALLGSATGMPVWQHAAVQILARPATGRRLDHRFRRGLLRPVSVVLDLITPGPLFARNHGHQATYQHTDHAARLEESAKARAIREKAHHPRYEVAIRYAVQADDLAIGDRDTMSAARAIRRRAITGRAHALASAFALFADHNRLERRRLLIPARRMATRRMHRGFLLSLPELAALAHLPLDTAVPGLQRAGANSVPPSPRIGRGGPEAKELGFSDSGHERPVALRVADSCHHVHILGPNGTGKSTLLAQMILSDIRAGRGVVVIDAKGDLITDLLGLVPPEAGERLVLIDPDDPHPRPALNILGSGERDTGVDNLVGIFHKIYAETWGPRTDDILRACAITLAGQGGTLADIPALLTDAAFRRDRLAYLSDGFLMGFWHWYDGLTEQTQAHVTAPIMNKLRAFLLRPFVREVLASEQSTFDMEKVLDGSILFARLPKGVLGDETARLIGSMLVAHVWQAASRRARLGRPRHPAALYIDETQNFLNLPHALSDMLAEARAYRLSMVMAHQHLAQLPRDLRQAVSSDARNKIYFSLSPQDAREAEQHFTPHLTAHDLANLDAYQAAARLMVAGAEAAPFTLRTRPLPSPSEEVSRQVRQAASLAHGRTRLQTVPPANDPRRLTEGETQ